MIVADRVKETTTTTGTGQVALAGAVAEFQSFVAAFGTGTWFEYAIAAQSGGEWETGAGYLSGSTTLVRARPVGGSAGAATLVSFSAGTKDVFAVIGAFSQNSVLGGLVAAATFQALP